MRGKVLVALGSVQMRLEDVRRMAPVGPIRVLADAVADLKAHWHEEPARPLLWD